MNTIEMKTLDKIRSCVIRWATSYWTFFTMTVFTWSITTAWLGVGWQDVDIIKALVVNLLPAFYMVTSYHLGKMHK